MTSLAKIQAAYDEFLLAHEEVSNASTSLNSAQPPIEPLFFEFQFEIDKYESDLAAYQSTLGGFEVEKEKAEKKVEKAAKKLSDEAPAGRWFKVENGGPSFSYIGFAASGELNIADADTAPENLPNLK